jgi:hypothetical protein
MEGQQLEEVFIITAVALFVALFLYDVLVTVCDINIVPLTSELQEILYQA